MTRYDDMPQYRELPHGDGLTARSSWGLWGRDDRCGSLNLVDAAKTKSGAAEVQKGCTFPLNLELELPDPPLSGRPRFRHRVTPVAGGLGNDDEYNEFNVQASSQLDGFAHVQHPQLGFYNGLTQNQHGMEHWARRGVASRGVIVDVARWRERDGRPLQHGTTDVITCADLVATIEAQEVSIETGDVLLIRTGFVSWYRELDHDHRQTFANDLRMPGLAQGEDMAELLWNFHPALIAADNMALEAWPPPCDISMLMQEPLGAEQNFLHIALIPLLGIPIGELWDLDKLASDCAEDNRYSCQITLAPMNMTGGIASMANAVAMK